MLAAGELVCPRCGNLRSVCSDPDVDWHPQESYCYADAAVQWKWRKLHEDWPAEVKAADGAHALDGIGVWVSDIDIESLTASGDQVANPGDPEGE